MNSFNFVLILVAFAFFLSPSLAELENVTICDIITIDGPSWADNHTILLFDPSHGELVGVNLTAGLELVQNLSFENTANYPQTIDFDYSIKLEVTALDAKPISTAASIQVSEELAGFDGEEDFSGPSGKTLVNVTSNSSETIECAELSDFVATAAGETITLPVQAIQVGGGKPVPSNFISMAEGSMRSKICVTYAFEPVASGEGGI